MVFLLLTFSLFQGYEILLNLTKYWNIDVEMKKVKKLTHWISKSYILLSFLFSGMFLSQTDNLDKYLKYK